ncbi:MAG: DUF1326 domain-containing protein [Acidobacteria bacterium]|nr:MAG: DUF1326 domain-containing protein [Acidobacteriota bacterium]
MFRTLSTLTILLLVAVPAWAAGYSVRGDYVEARTADVYTGACVANGEVNLTGKEAIMAWRVAEGEWNGVPLDGLSVVAVVKADSTLGDVTADSLSAQSVIVVDQKANPAQRQALISLAKTLGGDLLRDVLWVQQRSIEFETGGHGEASVQAGELASLETRCMSSTDHLCGNEDVYYPPLTQVAKPVPAFTLVNAFQGKGLNTTWSNGYKRSAFVATFAR